MEKISKDWRNDIYDVFKDIGISLVSHIPDAGHTPLIDWWKKKCFVNAIKWCGKLYQRFSFTCYL